MFMKKYLLSSIVMCMIFTSMLIKAGESALPAHVKCDVNTLRQKYKTEDFWEQVTKQSREGDFFVDPNHVDIFSRTPGQENLPLIHEYTVSCPTQGGQKEVEVFINKDKLFFKAHFSHPEQRPPLGNEFIYGVTATAVVGKPSLGVFRGCSVPVTEFVIPVSNVVIDQNSNKDEIEQLIQNEIQVLRTTHIYKDPLWKSGPVQLAAAHIALWAACNVSTKIPKF